MESRLQKPGEWQGTGLIPASGWWGVFGSANDDLSEVYVWVERVVGWVMAERMFTGGEYETHVYGVSMQDMEDGPSDPTAAFGPRTCEDVHDGECCHLGYQADPLPDLDRWKERARDHLKLCTSRKRGRGL